MYVPLLEDSEARKNNLTVDQPHGKTKSGIPREKEAKVDCTAILFPKGNKWKIRLSELFSQYSVTFGVGRKVGESRQDSFQP